MLNDKKILVLGIGALGGIFSFKLIENSFDCTLVTNNENITRAINENGIIYTNKGITKNQKATALTKMPENQKYDYIFLMMKTTAVAQVCQEIKTKSLLSAEGLIITIQNGDVYEFIKDFFPNQIVTCIIVWNAKMDGPGKYELLSPGKTIIGDRTNTIDLTTISQILSKISPSPIEISTNIVGIIWSKLAMNCAMNPLSGISGLLAGDVLKSKQGQEVFLAVYRETVELSKKQHITLEKLYADPNILYIPKKTNFVKKFIKYTILKIAGRKFGKAKSSMLQDIERGKLTEIDYLNGYVSQKAKTYNFPTPINDKLTELIKAIEAKKLEPNPDNLFLIKL